MNIRFAIYGAILGMLALVGAYYKGVWDEHEKYEAAAKSVRAQDVAIAKAMQPQLTHTLVVSGQLTTTLASEVPHVTHSYIPAPGLAPVARPDYYLTIGAVQLWDKALGSDPAAGVAPEATGTSASDLLLSRVSFADAETNALINFGQYRDCRTIVEGWQSWYRQVSEVKP